MLPQREVEVGGKTYKFYLIGGRKAFNASRTITAKLITLFPTLMSGSTNVEDILMDIIENEYDKLWKAFIDEHTIECDGRLIEDIDEHFAGCFTDMPKLLYKVIMENDKDFFASLPSLIEKGMEKLIEKQQVNSLPKANDLESLLKK